MRIRPFFFPLLALIIIILLIAGVVLVPYTLRVQHFSANKNNGYDADFYLYVSPDAKQAANQVDIVTILVQPNNSGTLSNDPEVHLKDAWWMGFGRHYLADDLGVVLLVPAFLRPADDWHIYTHALDRDVLTTDRHDLARLDLQLLAMVDTARTSLATEGILTDEKILIQGFSASGMFANRFTALHPGRVKGVAAGSPGGWPVVPLAEFEGERLNYPIGIADLERLTGYPFDLDSFNQVPQLIVMGSLDDNDSLDFTDGWDEEMAAIVNRKFGDTPLARWDEAERLYHMTGSNTQFILVDDVGHDRKQLQHYSTEFFAEILAR